MKYKVIAIFKLQPNKADEEIERCKSSGNLLNILKAFPGFISYEVVKISDESTMTIQTWETGEHFQSAISKAMMSQSEKNQARENLVVSYQSHSGEIVLTNL